MTTRMQQRRGTAEQWLEINPILASGEIGFETDTNKFKVGNGVAAWAALPYFLNSTDIGGSLDDYIPLTLLGEPDGVATLNSSGKVPSSQLDLASYATQQYVNDAVADVVGLAPEQLNTLSEIADALGDNANFLSDIATDIANAEQAAKDYADDQIAAIPPVDISGKQDKVTGVTDTEIGYLGGARSNIQDQLDAKLESGNLVGIATEDYADTAAANAVAALVASAPAALDTLNELAAALNDDANFAATITNSLAAKADTNSPTFTGLTDFQGIVDFSDAVVVGIDALPDQAGNAGKYLTTDGNTASWQTVASPVPHPFSMMG